MLNTDKQNMKKKEIFCGKMTGVGFEWSLNLRPQNTCKYIVQFASSEFNTLNTKVFLYLSNNQTSLFSMNRFLQIFKRKA